MRVCIIGAGIAGLSSAKHALHNGLQPTVYEQTDGVGGTWQYTDEIGINKYGIEVHTSMYKKLRTNLPKEMMGFPDFPIPQQEESYIPSEDILEYLNLYTDKFKIREHIQFLHYVVRVRPVNDEWEVTVKDLRLDVLRTEFFDYIIVANGHYSAPVWPKIEGLDDFKGRKIHSHDYRDPELFKGENVLVIGAGPSGIDLVKSVAKYAKFVALSHHLKEKLKTEFRSNVVQKPDVVKFSETEALFADNTAVPFTSVLLCTGYKYSFPFLSSDCGIHVENNYVQPLYKHCININHPTMAFIGIPFHVCATQMIDLQARFVMTYFSKKKQLPCQQQMREETEEEMEKRWKQGLQKHQAHMMGPIQFGYYTDLAETAGIKNIEPVMIKLYETSTKRFLHNTVHFRKDVFRVIDDTTFVKIN